MSETNATEAKYSNTKTNRGGIKSVNFYGGVRTNGVSHKKNKAKKKAQYLKNKQTRADLYMNKGSTSPGAWHSALAALSKGTA